MQSNQLTISQAHEKLKNKEISANELFRTCVSKIKKVDSKVEAFLNITEDLAKAQAKEIDEKIARGEEIGKLEGVPLAVKDNILIKDTKTTAASKVLENYISPYDAGVIKKLKEAGAVILGKTNLDEFAMGSSTENSAFKTTKNPWDFSRVPGGTSGGSAAAVAVDESIYALGSDTGGSIRQPASFCGVVGLKPTYGRISRYGLIAMASSLDQIGPITKDVEDSAIVLSYVAGTDLKDSTDVNIAVPDYTEKLIPAVKGFKIGLPKEYFEKGIDPEVKKVVEEAVKKLEKMGAKVESMSLPHSKYALAVYYIIMPSEVSTNLARYDGIRYGYSAKEAKNLEEVYFKTRKEALGPETKRRIMLGTFSLSAGYYDQYYAKAQKVRTLIKQDFDKAFLKYDVLITPTAPTVAFKIGEKIEDPLTMYMSDILTVPINLAGVPAISIPCGFVDNLPVGLQIIGKHFDEGRIFEVAYTYEQNTEWHKKKPKV